MMVGEFNFGDLFVLGSVENGTPTTQLAFVLFLLLVSIIIMNLLIGLAIRYNTVETTEYANIVRTDYLIKRILFVLTNIQQALGICEMSG